MVQTSNGGFMKYLEHRCLFGEVAVVQTSKPDCEKWLSCLVLFQFEVGFGKTFVYLPRLKWNLSFLFEGLFLDGACPCIIAFWSLVRKKNISVRNVDDSEVFCEPDEVCFESFTSTCSLFYFVVQASLKVQQLKNSRKLENFYVKDSSNMLWVKCLKFICISKTCFLF